MTKAILTLPLVALAAAGLAVPAIAAARPTPEQQLAKALEGRVAGKPVDCIDPRVNSDTQVIDHTAIIYGSGRTIYLQQPRDARSLDSDDILVTTLRGSGQLCSIDVVHLHDRSMGFNRGFVMLEKFVPYTRERIAGRD